jgi:hypothetical protein
MKCLNCKFDVDNSMKFALMKNICPACGSHLFSNEEVGDLTHLRKRINSQKFASELAEEVIFDIALFVMSEIRGGLGSKYLERMLDDLDPEIIRRKELEKAKREVEREYPELQNLEKEEEEEVEDEDSEGEGSSDDDPMISKEEKKLLEKIERKNKHLAKLQNSSGKIPSSARRNTVQQSNKSGPQVRRADD